MKNYETVQTKQQRVILIQCDFCDNTRRPGRTWNIIDESLGYIAEGDNIAPTPRIADQYEVGSRFCSDLNVTISIGEVTDEFRRSQPPNTGHFGNDIIWGHREFDICFRCVDRLLIQNLKTPVDGRLIRS